MIQILQHLRTGEMELAEVPAPRPGRGMLLIQTRRSLISAGTERMLVEFSKGNLLQKARSQPDKVKQVLDKIRTDGVAPTMEAVFRKLDEPLPLGYCNTGVVLEVGEGVHDFAPGDRVASNGNHAEIVCVPRNLCARIPDEVTDEQASFTVMGAIALQGVRLAQPTLGERFIVFGMGLLGLITVQLLRASGCEVLAVDLNTERLELARSFGAVPVNVGAGGDPVKAALAATNGVGVDGVIITASAKTDAIMHQAAQACRKRGRIILVGVVGLNLRRSDFFEKEITFQVSCSYGPGRYDERYEQDGQDYPIGFVRWTEQRNFEAILGALRSGQLNVDSLITHRFALADAIAAYEKIQHDSAALGVMLEYPTEVNLANTVQLNPAPASASGKPVVGVIGAGNFTKAVILPALGKEGARIKYVSAKSKAVSVVHAARKAGAEQAVMDADAILSDPEVNTVFVVTGHNTHARFVCAALDAGKHVFVEKPLALNRDQLDEVVAAARRNPDRIVMVGFNRRFSPHIRKMRELVAGRSEPLCMTMTVNAGEIPPDVWVQDPDKGGGRIIGEGCHFIDLLVYLSGAPVVSVSAAMVGEGVAVRDDKMSILLRFADGSIGVVNYFANGSKSYPKERLEVFSDGRTLVMDNFRKTTGYGFGKFKSFSTQTQDKGHRAEIHTFLERVAKGGKPPIALAELHNVTLASFAAVESARVGECVKV